MLFFLAKQQIQNPEISLQSLKAEKKQQIFIFPKLKPVNIWLFIINLSQ